MDSLKTRVGLRIKTIRKQAGLTQKGLGEKLGVSESTVNHYEAGKQNLTIETLEKIASVLDVEPATLLS